MPKANLMLYNLPQFKNLLIKKKRQNVWLIYRTQQH